METSDKKPFYGWCVVGMAFVANFMSVGTNFYIFNAFMEPLCAHRGWTRTDINLALMIGTFIGFFAQLLYGTLVMRTGPRVLMTVGALLAGAAFMLLGRAQELVTFYAFYVLLFLGNGALGGIVANTAVSNWFVKKRGKAMGTATAGVSLSGAIIPFIALMILQKAGLSMSFMYIGMALLFASPIAWITIRNTPEEHGMLPDGDAALTDQGPKPRSQETAKPGKKDFTDYFWKPRRLVRTGAFWKTGMGFAFVMMGVVGVMSQLKPRFADIGFSDRTAMAMMCATALLGAMGKYVWGYFCDKVDPRRVVAALIVGNAIGLGLALIKGSTLSMGLFIIVFGFSMGGVMSTFPIIVAHFFGRESFAPVLRFVALFLMFQLMGYLIAGRSYDITGSYDSAYMIYILLDLVAAALIISIKTPEPAK